MNAKGIDVSHWQGEINWPAVAGDGISFAFVKATERDSLTDSKFAFNWAGMKSAGILRGAYHFFRPSVDARAQAEHFATAVGALRANDLPPVLDLESRDGVSNDRIVESAKLWLDTVEGLLNRKPIIYTGPFFWNDHLVGGGNPPAWSGDYSLWVANYQVSQPLIPRGFNTWTFWQFTDKGTVAGVQNRVDLNWFHGTEDDLREFVGLDRLPDTRTYVAKPGDTLDAIAARFNSPLEALIRANPDLLQADQELEIPLRMESSAPIQFYTVQPGDTLTAIAQRFGVAVQSIVANNHIQNPDAIEVGRILKISS